MADLTLASTPATLADGYTTRTIEVEGVPMSFTFFMGFASRVTYTPRQGDPVAVYVQEGVFKLPGGKAPDSVTVNIQGGPDALDVKLEIDTTPATPEEFHGPVARIGVKTRKHVKEPKGNGKYYKVLKGAHQITQVDVATYGDPGGGVFAYQDDDGGNTTFDNRAATCPPHC